MICICVTALYLGVLVSVYQSSSSYSHIVQTRGHPYKLYRRHSCNNVRSLDPRTLLFMSSTCGLWNSLSADSVDFSYVVALRNSPHIDFYVIFILLVGLDRFPGRLGFKTCLSKTKTKTKTQQFQDQDFWCPRPRPRLKTYKTNTGSPWLGWTVTNRLKKSWQAENTAYW